MEGEGRHVDCQGGGWEFVDFSFENAVRMDDTPWVLKRFGGVCFAEQFCTFLYVFKLRVVLFAV